MPKLKTKSAAKKRFSVTATGKIKCKAAYTRHMMRNKSTKMKRQARGTHILNEMDTNTILINYLPYARSKARRPRPKAVITAQVEA